MRNPSGVGYLCGPMTGHPNYNYDLFNGTAHALRMQGKTIHNPAEHYGGDTTLARPFYIRAAVLAVLNSDYLVLLPGYESSAGARLEVLLALEMGLPLFRYTPETGTLEHVGNPYE